LSRILVTGDVLRPQEDVFKAAQTGNILWLHRLLRRKLEAATGLPVETLNWGGGFDTPLFYALAGATPDIEGWVALFDAGDLPRDSAALLARPFADASVVIGFELAEVQKRMLTWLGIPFVDVNLHPCRFGPDVLFAITTNHPEIAAALAPHHADDAVFFDWADLLSAQAVKMLPHIPVEESCLVVGQTRVDRALIAGGRLVDLSDHAASLRAAIGPRGRFLFRPHPYNPEGFGLHDCGIPFARIREAPENAYVLMAQDAVRRVVGVSSSMVEEARWFGREGVFLGTPPFRLARRRDALEPGMHASVVSAWAEADFWRDLLAPVLPVTAKDGHRASLAPHSLRNALRQFWGIEELAFGLPVELTMQKVAARAS
jgi:hypothetical protein